MKTITTYSAGQMTTVFLSAALLMTDPGMAQLVVLFISFTMAYTMGCALTVGYYYSSRGIEKLSRKHACLLGTQLGGIVCYIIVICAAYEQIH